MQKLNFTACVILRYYYYYYTYQLEIWGRAQREATRGRKSDWGDNLGDEIWLLRKPHGNAIALAYTARVVFILGG